MKMHDDSETHRKCLHTLISRRSTDSRINTALDIQINEEQRSWTNVLQRVVSVIEFLSSRELAFRGDTELFGSPHNGNYLGINRGV